MIAAPTLSVIAGLLSGKIATVGVYMTKNSLVHAAALSNGVVVVTSLLGVWLKV
ncbi:hypothetical protein ACU6TU_09175 [Halomonas sp. LS-001]